MHYISSMTSPSFTMPEPEPGTVGPVDHQVYSDGKEHVLIDTASFQRFSSHSFHKQLLRERLGESIVAYLVLTKPLLCLNHCNVKGPKKSPAAISSTGTPHRSSTPTHVVKRSLRHCRRYTTVMEGAGTTRVYIRTRPGRQCCQGWLGAAGARAHSVFWISPPAPPFSRIKSRNPGLGVVF